MLPLDQAQDEEHQAGSKNGIENLTQHSAKYRDAEVSSQPSADDGADDPNDDILHKTEAAALHDLTGKPASNGAYHEPNDQTFYRHRSSRLTQRGTTPPLFARFFGAERIPGIGVQAEIQ